MFLGLLNPNPTLELLHQLRFLKFPNLKAQNTQFFAIFGFILHTLGLMKQSLKLRTKTINVSSTCNLNFQNRLMLKLRKVYL